MRAALLWVGEGAVLSGAAAAWWAGLLRHPPATITVTVTAARRPPRLRPGIVVRRRELEAVDLAERRGIRLTACPLTVLEAAVELGVAGAPLLDRALQGRLPFPDLDAAYRRNPSAGARLLLAAAADRSRAAAQRLLVRLMLDSGTSGWRAGGPGVAQLMRDAGAPGFRGPGRAGLLLDSGTSDRCADGSAVAQQSCDAGTPGLRAGGPGPAGLLLDSGTSGGCAGRPVAARLTG